MTEVELRDAVLKSFYDARDSSRPIQLDNIKVDGSPSDVAIDRVCQHLKGTGLITWTAMATTAGPNGHGQITSRGVEYMESRS